MTLYDTIFSYVPQCRAEETDRRVMLHTLSVFDNLLTRENALAHFTASSWITNPSHDRVLLVFHNIYKSWSWTGGHADGDADLAAVALREAREETGISRIRLASDKPCSLEILGVPPHEKRGQFVNAHLHMNLTYFAIADDRDALHIKADENSGVRWFLPEDAVRETSEEMMVPIYEKLNERLRTCSLPDSL